MASRSWILRPVLVIPLVALISLISIIFFSNLLASPLNPSLDSDFEVILFQALIGAFTLFFPLLIVAIQLMYPRRLLEIRDVLWNPWIIAGMSIFLISTTLPILLIHVMTLNYESVITLIVLDSFHVIAIVMILLLFGLLFTLLDSESYLDFSIHSTERILKQIKRIDGIEARKQETEIHTKMLRNLDRLYDALVVSINENDSRLTFLAIRTLVGIARNIEENWNKYHSIEISSDKTLAKLIKETKSATGIEKNIPELLGNMVWNCIYRIRSAILIAWKDPFMRSRLLFELNKQIVESLNNECYITVKAYEHSTSYIIRELLRLEGKEDRFIEILGHQVHFLGSKGYQLLIKRGSIDVKKPNNWLKNWINDMNPSIKTSCYDFVNPDEPLQEIVVVFLKLLNQLHLAIGPKRFNEMSNEAIYHSERLVTHLHYEVQGKDIQMLQDLYKKTKKDWSQIFKDANK